MQIYTKACVATLWLAVCECEIVEDDDEPVETAAEQEGFNLKGMNLQGMIL
jgi:hypothetical protein